MEKHLELQDLEKQAWPLKKEFLKIVEPHRSDLWKYCRYLTGSPWDAEDLAQETLLKAFASLGQFWQVLNPKSYLFRMATNAWINQNRKNRFTSGEFKEEMIEEETEAPRYRVTEAMETLVEQLPVRQVIVILLNDVFDFTAREAAEIMSTTEGAVKAALHRARTKLKTGSPGEKNKMKAHSNDRPKKQVNARTLEAFVEAFNRRDPDAMAALLDENAYHDIIHVGQEYGRDTIRKYSIADDFRDPTVDLQHAEVRELWGRPVMAVFIQQPSELQLHDIMYVETEEDRIVFFRNYYFCDDFLKESANAFDMPIQSEDTKWIKE